MRLLEAACHQNLKSLSIIGMAKNAGKTVTLNHLLEDAYNEGVVLGLTSIGRDGERLDLVTKTDKPTIYVYEGTLLATAESLIELSTARVEILQATEIYTAMGRIVIARVRADGFVQLAGPATTAGIRQVIALLHHWGARLAIVDGALDRQSLASPTVTDATVLATGAVISRNMDHVILETVHRVKLLRTAVAEGDGLALGIQASKRNTLGWQPDGGLVQWFEFASALGAGRKLASLVPQGVTGNIALPGGLVEQTIQDFLEVRGDLNGLTWIVQDATKLFLSAKTMPKLEKRGFVVRVVSPMKLLGVTVNPVAPQGYAFSSEIFTGQMAERLEGIPVFDVYREEALWNY